MRLQEFSDDFLDRTLLPFIPYAISPNQVSWIRIAALPFIYYLLISENYKIGFILFIVAALTDALDGAMARKRDQVTESGKILDAVADRGLIALVGIILIPQYIGWWLVIAMILLEFLNAAMASRSRRKLGYNPGANGAGKIKMALQCIAFGLIFLYRIDTNPFFLTISYYLLLTSLFFTLLQGFLYKQET